MKLSDINLILLFYQIKKIYKNNNNIFIIFGPYLNMSHDNYTMKKITLKLI